VKRCVMASRGTASTKRLNCWIQAKGSALLKNGSEAVNLRVTDISDGRQDNFYSGDKRLTCIRPVRVKSIHITCAS
jgi:hypothetical protein